MITCDAEDSSHGFRRAIPALGEYTTIQAEVKSGPAGKSRVDFLLERPSGSLVYVEVKSVTLTEDVASPKASGKASATADVANAV